MNSTSSPETETAARVREVRDRLGERIVGQQSLIDRLLIALLADGHLLVEGAPGLAKTTAVKALAESIEGFATFQQRFGVPVVFHRHGYLLLAEPNQAEAVNRAAAAATNARCASRRITGAEARELQPGLRTDDDGTIFLWEAGAVHVDPMPTLQAVRQTADQRGVDLVEGPHEDLEGQAHAVWDPTVDGVPLQALAFEFVIEQQQLEVVE